MLSTKIKASSKTCSNPNPRSANMLLIQMWLGSVSKQVQGLELGFTVVEREEDLHAGCCNTLTLVKIPLRVYFKDDFMNICRVYRTWRQLEIIQGKNAAAVAGGGSNEAMNILSKRYASHHLRGSNTTSKATQSHPANQPTSAPTEEQLSGFLPTFRPPPQARLGLHLLWSVQLQPPAYPAFPSGGERYIHTYRRAMSDTSGWRNAGNEMTGTDVSTVNVLFTWKLTRKLHFPQWAPIQRGLIAQSWKHYWCS